MSCLDLSMQVMLARLASFSLAVLVILGAGTALADEGRGKPDPAFTAAWKPYLGNWKCEVTFTPPGGKPVSLKVALKFESQLDGFFVVEHIDLGQVHHGSTATGRRRRNSTANGFSTEGIKAETLKGPDADGKLAFSGSGSDDGKPVNVHHTFAMAKDSHSFLFDGDDGDGPYTATCKR